MATSKLKEVVQHIRRIVPLPNGGELTDGQLMEEFISRQNETALAALARRHGPMVWGVCCRTLRNNHDAEDAFQSTFLVLVRKATSVVPKETVGNWLYGVAHRTALNARAIASRRRRKEKPVTDLPEPSHEHKLHDLLPLLDQELSRLPDKYRAVIVLCDLEGKTRKEAAKQLNVPEGTVAGRVARARAMLGKRLARHGAGVSSGALTAGLSQNVTSAAGLVPLSVMSSTIQAVTSIAAGQPASGVISAKVAALTAGVMKSMLLTKLKTVAALLLMLSMVTLTSAMLAWSQTEEKANGVEQAAAQPVKPAAEAPAKDPPKNFTNGIGMEFVWIPPGNFVMGSPKEEKGRDADETQHKVTLTKGFYMGVYTVTQEQWKEVMGKNTSDFKAGTNLPVVTVSWQDCQAFIKKLREMDKDKKPYRLPTEAEWEYACRAGTTTPFHFGETISTDQANYNGTFTYGEGKKGIYRKKPLPAGNFPANAWGLHDMHGNVCQWCQDWLGDYPQKDVVDPQGPDKGELRVLRGESYRSKPQFCRSACRDGSEPSDGYSYIGFRLATSLPLSAQGPKLHATFTHTKLAEDVRTLTFSGDDKLLASSDHHSGKLWDVATGKEIATFRTTSMMRSLVFSRDGKLLATGPSLWDVTTNMEKTTFKKVFRGLAFNNDGKLLAAENSNGGETWRVTDVLGEKEIVAFKVSRQVFVRVVAFSGDGRLLALGCQPDRDTDGIVEIWNLTTGKQTANINVDGAVFSLAFSGDGKLLASGHEAEDRKTIKLWDVATGKEKATLQGHRWRVESVAFSQNGKLLASADQTSVKLWDVATGKEIADLPGGARSVAFSGDGKLLATGHRNVVKLWAFPEIMKLDK